MPLNKTFNSHLAEQAVKCSNLCILDQRLYILYCNRNLSDLLHYTADEITGTSLINLINSDNKSRADFLSTTLENHQVFKGELQLRTKSNEILWLDSIISPASTDNDTHYIAFLTDSSPRKKLIDGLKQRAHRQGIIAILGQVSLSNISVSDLLDQTLAVVCGSLGMSAGAMLELSIDGNSSLVKACYNTPQIKQGKTIIRTSRDNLIGFTMNSDTPVITPFIKDEKRFTFPVELRIDRYTSATCLLIGDKKYPFGMLLLFSKNPVKLVFDEINFLQSICNILAEGINRKHMELSLKYERELSRKYIDVAEALIIILDPYEKIILANQYASKTLGYPPEELTGMNFIDNFISEPSRVTFRNDFHRLFDNADINPGPQPLHESTITVLTKSRQLRTIKWRSSLVIDDTNTITSIVSAGEDITDRLLKEMQQKQLEKQLNQAQRMEAIGMLAGGIAHDFNNILASILGFSDLSIERIADKDEKLLNYLNHIKSSGQKARDIIEQMQSINLQDEETSHAIMLPTLLKSTLKMLRSALPSSIDLNISLNTDLPPAFVNAARFNQILMQLLVNARNALKGKGRITIGLDLLSAEGLTCTSCHQILESEYLSLLIEDNGPGLSDDIIQRLADQYENRPDNGLSIVNNILHTSNAHLIITSPSDPDSQSGTRIQLLFPVDQQPGNTSTSVTSLSLDSVKGKSVMIVDDENSVASFMGELFRNAGFEASIFCDAIEALKVFQQQSEEFDLVITDQTMPGLTGDLLAQKMLEARPELPIILCTGHSTVIDQDSAKQLNIRGFLKKPVDSAELLQMSFNLLTSTQQA